ncbi:MAG: HAMP domain-containing histidine kinase [Candidatus Marinimicrobia bacterium]|nr:HAMP domain-containing histidine kinase [Candidatus Neomarinimicrobiota bacterium]
MTAYRYTANLKAGLFALGAIIVASLLWYTQSLVHDLQQDERKLLGIYANLIGKVATSASSEELGFVFDEVISQIQFPIVVTSREGQVVSWRNVRLDSSLAEADRQAYLQRIVERMDRQHTPVEVRFEDLIISRIHYGDSSTVSRLRWLPYIEIAVAGLFILIGFIGFTLIRNSEKRSIWAGMARETAHQLGTPVSSLMGWLHLLRDKAPQGQGQELLDELESDVHRLEQIADRFQKVGSIPRFEPVNLYELAESSAEYFRQRLPKTSRTEIAVTGEECGVYGAETLLQWVLENLIKNAIDACQGRQGRIEVNIRGDKDRRGRCLTHVEVRDNGSGISPRDRRNIFRPGYSTKRRGWGLGLSLARRIVEEIHKGRLRLVSSRPGETIIRATLVNCVGKEAD